MAEQMSYEGFSAGNLLAQFLPPALDVTSFDRHNLNLHN